ncbi:Cytochrome c oxidase subunit 6B [Entomophthora muscae]|uniref:Cytochrome c oxidase subunit 6B n=2 Tax=Entomophthora muscae TaxID=34485 RepID=A0ACC2RZL4_9FUNG|nr:Cytochrome c oxidase subunit 6B [Entomophthora muscae]KAJ9089544.1 Cytochrome c oxidase subunit 6B [Entomophthora muscae]
MSEAAERKINKLETAPFDARFPNTNQTKHCWQSYVDYHKCIGAKGEDSSLCVQFFKNYNSLCPSSWIDRWNDQLEAGTFASNINPNA